MDVAAIPVESLAIWQLEAMGGAGDPFGQQTIACNLAAARALGQLHLDIESDRCTGYVAWIRLTLPQLLEVTRSRRMIFTAADDTPHAPVLFIMEQMNHAPGVLRRRQRWLAALPGVEVLAGWRHWRLRLHRVRRAAR